MPLRKLRCRMRMESARSPEGTQAEMLDSKHEGRYSRLFLVVWVVWLLLQVWHADARTGTGGDHVNLPRTGAAESPVVPNLPCLRRPNLGRTGQAIQVEVVLVTVPVTVIDRNGTFVTGLQASDFHIFENGKEQAIDRIIPESDPLNIALMLDRSGSTQFRLEDIQSAALSFIEALRPQDRVLIASFDSDVDFHTGFTDDRERLRGAVLQIRSSSRRTAFYDALYTTLQEQLEGIAGRKAAVLFTDGVDNESRLIDGDGLLKSIERSDLLVYAIQYDTRKGARPDRMRVPLPQGMVSFDTLYSRAVKYLRKLSGDSGGRLFPADTMESLQQAFARIAEELPRQYALCYYPAPVKRDSYRNLKVTVDRPGVTVRARAGYRTSR
jgi:Ca-activated chloride channel family protein